MTQTTRYTMLLDDSAPATVERLQATYGLKNKADVYDMAIRVLHWMTEQQFADYEIGRYKDEAFQPLLLLCAPNKRARKESQT